MRDLDVPALTAAEELLGGGTRRGRYGSALGTPFCSERPCARTADISLSSVCSVSVAISSRWVYVLKVELGQGELPDFDPAELIHMRWQSGSTAPPLPLPAAARNTVDPSRPARARCECSGGILILLEPCTL